MTAELQSLRVAGSQPYQYESLLEQRQTWILNKTCCLGALGAVREVKATWTLHAKVAPFLFILSIIAIKSFLLPDI